MSAANLIAVPVFADSVYCAASPGKLLEMEQEANHIVVFETFERQTGMLLYCRSHLEMISILTSFMGYGLGIGIAGLIGGRLSESAAEKNRMALAGMILSGICYWRYRSLE